MSEYLSKYDVWIDYEKMPHAVKGFATELVGERIAVINDSLTDEAKIRAVAHEIRHHERGDLWEEKRTVKEMEIDADSPQTSKRQLEMSNKAR